MTVDRYRSTRRSEISGNNVHRRRFSGSVRAQESIDFARFHCKRQMIYRYVIPVFFHKVVYFNQCESLLFLDSCNALLLAAAALHTIQSMLISCVNYGDFVFFL